MSIYVHALSTSKNESLPTACTPMLWLLCCRGCNVVTTTALVAEYASNNLANWLHRHFSLCTRGSFFHFLASQR